MTEPLTAIKFVYREAPGYRVLPVSGAHGGITPPGLVKMDLFLEFVTPLLSVTHTLNPDGSLGPETEREPGDTTLTRELQMGFVLTPEDAEKIGRWLLEKAAQGRKERQEQ